VLVLEEMREKIFWYLHIDNRGSNFRGANINYIFMLFL